MHNRFLSYLNFLWHSKNEHGVHSPFIFNFVTRCLYGKKNYDGNKTQNVVFKSLAYFQCHNITIVPTDPSLESQVKNLFPAISLESSSAELIFIADCNEELLLNYIYNNNGIGNNSMVILGNIYQSKESAILWKKLKESNKVTVTVDMYYCAAIFFRKEQVAQHFKIRI
ncbi:hypothetical protein OO009_09775 [Flavobacteriaceae bacterium KMM 6897]|nr:hypothetical protein [Flavobacteriaceae bacterium KMM 6897]